MNTDNHNDKIFPADPRVTAYAFGELEGDELKRLEEAVSADPELQATVAELRAFSGQLREAFAGEAATEGVSEDAHVRIAGPKKRGGRRFAFPFHYLATAVAACFAVVVWVRQDDAAPAQKRLPDEPAATRFESPLQQDLDHRVQLARKNAASPVEGSALFADSQIEFNAEAKMKASPPSPPPPSAPREDVVAYQRFEAVKPQAVSMPASGGFGVGLGTGVGQGHGVAPSRAPADIGVGLVSGEVRRMRSPSLSMAATVVAESYASLSDNAFRSVTDEPLSTFSIDVDTASYSNVRRFISGGRLPPRDAVRVEELINYFPYRYASPRDGTPFAAHLATEFAPWNANHRVVRIALKGRELTTATRPAANLVFLLDVSGSMNSANKLPLVKESLRLLVERLRPDDRVAIVTYAGGSGLALPSTPASQKHEILASLDRLDAGGSTNGAMGIHLAYDIAKANFVGDGGVNRVILCTDGDFNVGVTNRDELVRLIEEKARSRVFLSVLGFGMGNLKDSTLESLSAKGNGTYGYIDSRREAEKVFVEQVEGTLVTIAKDVKVQVEFNPARVASYRLIGYENRMLKKEDFNNDRVDAGDVGAGHTVTALYEIVLVGAETNGAPGGGGPSVDPLKYQTTKRAADTTDVVRPSNVASEELLTVKIRYKEPEGDVSKKLEFPLTDDGAKFTVQPDEEFRFAMAVAAWGMLLSNSEHKGSATFEQVLELAEGGLRNDASGYRAEFLQLVRRSAELAR